MSFVKVPGLAFADSALQFSRGDRFAIVEAIALCAENGWDYPDWVKDEINAAFMHFYRTVYPDTDLRLGRRAHDPGDQRQVADKSEPSLEPLNPKEMEPQLRKARQKFNETLGLSAKGTSIVKRRQVILRDMVLAELVAAKSKFKPKPKPKFEGVREAVRNVERELNKALPQRRKRTVVIAPPYAIIPIPPECWNANILTIEAAWSKWHQVLEEYYDSIAE